MLVMISPVPFLFSLSLFLSFSRPPLFFSLRSGFPPVSLPLLTPGCGGGGGRRGAVWMPGFCRGWGEVGEVAILKKRNSVWIPAPGGAGSGRAGPGRGRDMAIGGVGRGAGARPPAGLGTGEVGLRLKVAPGWVGRGAADGWSWRRRWRRRRRGSRGRLRRVWGRRGARAAGRGARPGSRADVGCGSRAEAEARQPGRRAAREVPAEPRGGRSGAPGRNKMRGQAAQTEPGRRGLADPPPGPGRAESATKVHRSPPGRGHTHTRQLETRAPSSTRASGPSAPPSRFSLRDS